MLLGTSPDIWTWTLKTRPTRFPMTPISSPLPLIPHFYLFLKSTFTASTGTWLHAMAAASSSSIIFYPFHFLAIPFLWSLCHWYIFVLIFVTDSLAHYVVARRSVSGDSVIMLFIAAFGW